MPTITRLKARGVLKLSKCRERIVIVLYTKYDERPLASGSRLFWHWQRLDG